MNKRITLLYVDDEEINLFIFKANFEEKFKVIAKSSPFEALEELDNYSDDIIVVISDMRMPKMDGLAFINEAKSRVPNILYCILTGYDQDVRIVKALDDGLIQKFFSKPFNQKEIEDVVLNEAKRRGIS